MVPGVLRTPAGTFLLGASDSGALLNELADVVEAVAARAVRQADVRELGELAHAGGRHAERTSRVSAAHDELEMFHGFNT
jgi:hypothetical protein